MNQLGAGGTGLALDSQVISKNAGQGVCSQATGDGTWMKSL